MNFESSIQKSAPPTWSASSAVSNSPLDASKALFIRRWGEMGGYWGINRTMAEIHALLFVSTQPICTDDVMAQLEVSRGNASMNLRSLVDWGLIRRVHLRGDRKEYFVCETNVWEMFDTIVRQRRRREVEPIIETIERCRAMVGPPQGDAAEKSAARNPDAAAPNEAETYSRRLTEMHDFLQAVGAMADLLLKVGPQGFDRMRDVLKLVTPDAKPPLTGK